MKTLVTLNSIPNNIAAKVVARPVLVIKTANTNMVRVTIVPPATM